MNKELLKNKLLCVSQGWFDEIMLWLGWDDEHLPSEEHALISITESDEKSRCSHWFKRDHKNVINLHFDDIDGESEIWKDYKRYSNGDIQYRDQRLHPMHRVEAQALLRFINYHKGKRFIIHCQAGVSRSQAVVRFILDTFPEEYNITDCWQKNLPITPNVYVLALLKRWWRNFEEWN